MIRFFYSENFATIVGVGDVYVLLFLYTNVQSQTKSDWLLQVLNNYLPTAIQIVPLHHLLLPLLP
jgi:hypothetical protein